MSERYSIVFQPPVEVIEQVDLMKSELAAVIGWYSSRNSSAHLTIQEFEVDVAKIDLITRQLSRSCDELSPIELFFNGFESFPNGAFFMQPDLKSTCALSEMMKTIQQRVPTPNTHRGSTPHLTIGRRLSSEKILIAHELFPSIDLRFTCDTVALRRFNTSKKQFEITESFGLLGLPNSLGTQGVLF